MTTTDKDIDKILDQLVTSTRSPRGRFSAQKSWRILEKRLFSTTGKIKFFRIAGSVAASILFCLAGWYTYDYVRSTSIQTISTLAEIQEITLPDQSVVTLNLSKPIPKIRKYGQPSLKAPLKSASREKTSNLSFPPTKVQSITGYGKVSNMK